jgi:hypothetical protein
MNLFVLFGDGAIIRKKNGRNFASCATRNDAVLHHALQSATRNDAVSCHFFSGDTPSPNKTNKFTP